MLCLPQKIKMSEASEAPAPRSKKSVMLSGVVAGNTAICTVGVGTMPMSITAQPAARRPAARVSATMAATTPTVTITAHAFLGFGCSLAM